MNYISKQKSRNSMEQQTCKHNVHEIYVYSYCGETFVNTSPVSSHGNCLLPWLREGIALASMYIARPASNPHKALIYLLDCLAILVIESSSDLVLYSNGKLKRSWY